MFPIIDPPQTLRGYQIDAKNAVYTAWARRKANEQRIAALISLGPGSGKTTIFSQIVVETIDPATERCVIIVHTEEIVMQIAARVAQQYGSSLQRFYGPNFDPGLGIVMGSRYNAYNARIIVASRQTLQSDRRLQQVLNCGQIKILVVDECHHVAPGNTYDRIIKKILEQNNDLRILGVTATPHRADKKALGAIFDEIVYTRTMVEAIAHGDLVPIHGIRVKTTIDMGKIKIRAGDYAADEVVSLLDANNWLDLAKDAFKTYFGETDRQIIAFFPSIQMSKDFADALNGMGIPAVHLDKDTPKSKLNNVRKQVVEDFKARKIRVICNMGLFTEGVDIPICDGIFWCRPTRNSGLFCQCIGRCGRRYPGKFDGFVVELTTKDVSAVSLGTLLGRMLWCANLKCGARFYAGYDACPVCQTPIQKREKVEKDEALHDPLLAAMHKSTDSGLGIGEGLIEETLSIFNNAKASWYTDEFGRASASLGFDGGGLVIMPPREETPELMAHLDRLQQRISKGVAELNRLESVGESAADMVNQIDLLQAEMVRLTHYTMYYVAKDRTAAFIRAESELERMVIMADYDVIKFAGRSFKNEAAKGADWRENPALKYPKQIGLLQAKQRDPEVAKAKCIKHGLDLKTVTAGYVAALIDHATLIPPLIEWIDGHCLLDPQK